MEAIKLGTFVVLVTLGIAAIAVADDPTCGQMIHEFDFTSPEGHDWLVANKDKVLACVESMSCGEMMMEVGKRQMKEVEICGKELNYQSAAERKAKQFCTFKCVMKKAKFLTADGKIDEHIVKDMLERYTPMIPPRFLPMIKKSEEMFKHCRDEHESKFDDTEETCASYGPLIQCLMGMMKLCDEVKAA